MHSCVITCLNVFQAPRSTITTPTPPTKNTTTTISAPPPASFPNYCLIYSDCAPYSHAAAQLCTRAPISRRVRGLVWHVLHLPVAQTLHCTPLHRSLLAHPVTRLLCHLQHTVRLHHHQNKTITHPSQTA